ncbi:MAG: hypothetical protein VB878_17740 [Pirellulaceae bacterium]|jgi:hypothetical protein
MRNQFDVQANDLQAADLECVVSMNAHQFASKHPRYSRRGKMGIAMLGIRPSKHDGHPAIAGPCYLPVLPLPVTWRRTLCLGQETIAS